MPSRRFYPNLVFISRASLFSGLLCLTTGDLRATASPTAVAAAGSGLDAAWTDLSLRLADQAEPRFAALSGREARLGEALAALGANNRRGALLTEAAARLEALVAEAPDDDVGLAARYHLARHALLHREPADPRRAAELYRALLDDAPDHPTGQKAAARLAIVLLFDPEVDFDLALAELQARAAHVVEPVARRDLALALGTALVRVRGDHAAALAHLQIAADTPGTTKPVRMRILLQLAESARAAGDAPRAARAYDEWLALAPRSALTAELGRRRAAVAEGLVP